METMLVSRQAREAMTSGATMTWGDAERGRLRTTRQHAGHSMATCAHILRVDFGVASASQPNISRWETGAIRRPECVNELLAYCDAYDPSMNIASASWRVSRTGQIGDSLTEVPAVDSSVDDADEFERLAGQAAGEPLLGEAQLELIRGMIHRLAHGPPLSPEDRTTYLDLLRILRVPGRYADR
jgi:hypothetical protein